MRRWPPAFWQVSACSAPCPNSPLKTRWMRSERAPATTELSACQKASARPSLPNGIGHARQLAVAKDGTVYVEYVERRLLRQRYAARGGFLVALKDTNGDGRADAKSLRRDPRARRRRRHGHRALQERAVRGSERQSCATHCRAGDRAGGRRDNSVGMPLTGDHPMHPFAIDAQGGLFVSLGRPPTPARSRTACPTRRATSRARSSRRGPASGATTPTGPGSSSLRRALRHRAPQRGRHRLRLPGRLYATQHGRDQLRENWPSLYTPEQGAKSRRRSWCSSRRVPATAGQTATST